MADAAQRGASEHEVDVRLIQARDAKAEDLLGRICTGWRLKRISEPLIVCTHAQTPEKILAQKTIAADDLQRCEEIGAAIAAGLALGIF
jgi:hypothetical protein